MEEAGDGTYRPPTGGVAVLQRATREGHEADGAVVDLDEEAVRDEDVEVGRQLEGSSAPARC